MFHKIDFNSDGQLNYTEFLAATINKEKVVTKQNLSLAFHHFDVDNTGFISAENLVEAFRRQGKKIDLETAKSIIKEASPTDGITLDQDTFFTLM